MYNEILILLFIFYFVLTIRLLQVFLDYLIISINQIHILDVILYVLLNVRLPYSFFITFTITRTLEFSYICI